MPKRANKPKRLYWDSCVFLSFIEGNPDRAPIIEALIEQCERGDFEIYTSVLTIAEVAFGKAEKDGKALDKQTHRKINGLWASGSPFKLAEVHRGIMMEAQTFVRSAMPLGLGLKPPDAIHLATAKRLGATEFTTYDDFRGKSVSVASFVGLKIRVPKSEGFIFKGVQGEK